MRGMHGCSFGWLHLDTASHERLPVQTGAALHHDATEINVRERDIVIMRVALRAGADVYWSAISIAGARLRLYLAHGTG